MNSYITYQPDMPVAYDGRRYVIIHILSLEEVLAKDSESGKVGALKVCDLEPIESLTLSEEREAQEFTLIPQDAWAEGETMTMEQALDLALDELKD